VKRATSDDTRARREPAEMLGLLVDGLRES